MSLSKLQIFVRDYSARVKAITEIIVVDFELYEQSGNKLVISEIGASKFNLVTKEINQFHAILPPPKKYSSIVSAKYVSN